MDKPLEKNEKFGGLYAPNTTPVPDNFFDELMPTLSGAELKVVLYIIRRTFGFKRTSDSISISQMLDGITKKNGEILDYGTGLAKSTLMVALKSLIERNIIVQKRRFDIRGGNIATEYAVNVRLAKPSIKTVDKMEEDAYIPSPKIGTGGDVRKSVQGESGNQTKGLYRKSDIQETVIQDTVKKTVNGSTESFKSKKIKSDLDSVANEQHGGNTRFSTEKRPHGTSPLHDLPNLGIEQDEIQATAEWILGQMGDRKSSNFYHLIASKVPRKVIAEHLGNIKTFGANNPPSLFNHRMTKYARERLEQRAHSNQKETLHSLTKDLADSLKMP